MSESGAPAAWRFVRPAEVAGATAGGLGGRLRTLGGRLRGPATPDPAAAQADPEALMRALAEAMQRQGSPRRLAVLDPPGSGAAQALGLLAERWRLRLLGPDAPSAELGTGEALVVPRLERMFLRTPAGLERLRTLLEALLRRDAPTIVGCGSWAWRYLGAALDLDLGFPHQLVPAHSLAAADGGPLPAALETADLLCLQAMLLHGGLEEQALALLVPLSGLELRLRLERLGELRLAGHGGQGWAVTPAAYPALRRAMAAAGLWVDELVWRSAGARTPAVRTAASFHLAPDHDAGQVLARLRDLALASALVALGRPVSVSVEEQPWGTCYRIHAEPAQRALAGWLTSELTVRGKALLLALGCRPAAAPPVAEAGRDDPNG